MLKKVPIAAGACAVLLTLSPFAARGDDPGKPSLDPLPHEEIFVHRQYLTSGGVSVQAADQLVIEPVFGLGHDERRRGNTSLRVEDYHSVTAQAGGKVRVLDDFYLSAALKYPVYSYLRQVSLLPGSSSTGSGNFDILNPSGQNVTWTGEIGTSLGKDISSSFFYDKTANPLTGGPSSQSEDRFGIRFQLRFK